MNRRNAIKKLGGIVIATAVASGFRVPAFATSAVQEKKRLVFYFSATGNSLYVARQFSDNPISIPQALKEADLVFEADEIGFVFPDFVAAAPLIVREFLEKGTFKAHYFFSIITFGNYAANVANWWDNYTREQDVTNNYINTLLMVDNYLPAFDMIQQQAMDKNIDQNLTRIIEDVNVQKNMIPEVPDMGPMGGMLANLQSEHFGVKSEDILLVNDSKCIRCKICVKICPRANFILSDGKIEYSGDCEYCLACVQNCPQKAITLVRGERNPDARFRNPHVSLNDLIKANTQL